MFDIQKFIKDVGEVITEKLAAYNKRVEDVEVKLKDFTPYDDEAVIELMSKQETHIKTLQDEVVEIKKIEIPPPYDEAKLLKSVEDQNKVIEGLSAAGEKVAKFIKEFKAFDDSDMKEAIRLQSESVEELSAAGKEVAKFIAEFKSYDDTKLKESLKINSEHWGELHKKFENLEIPAAYDDTEMLKVIDAQHEVIKTVLKEVEQVKSMQIPSIMPKAVDFDSTPIDKGIFVKHMNSLWLNLLDENDTVPSLENKSYQQLIKAPREIEHKGLYKEDAKYEAGDIVMFNDAGWFKTADPETAIPSAGWKLIAKQGKQGKKGETRIIENDTTEAMQLIYDEVQQLKGNLKRLEDASKN